jgi:hypothetical protein
MSKKKEKARDASLADFLLHSKKYEYGLKDL